MKTKKILGVALLLGTMMLTACGGGNNSSSGGKASSGGNKTSQNTQSTQSSPKPSTPSTAKSVSITEMKLANVEGKVYVVVKGTEANYKAEEFKWAWGLKTNGDSGEFIDGKETPEAADYKAATFDATTKAFEVKYCLTDLTLTSGAYYQVYGGTPETYANIAFEDANTTARDQTRSYYLRTDQNNSIVFDAVQPISFTKAAVVDLAAADLPTGITNAGPYLKFGGANAANLTIADIDAWVADNKVAGNFQRVIGGYQLHNHTAEERFYKIEGSDIFFYCYIGFIADGEGWMTHFDCVNGNSGANLQMDATFWGDADHTKVIGENTYRVYADKTKTGEENFWSCLGVTLNYEA